PRALRRAIQNFVRSRYFKIFANFVGLAFQFSELSELLNSVHKAAICGMPKSRWCCSSGREKNQPENEVRLGKLPRPTGWQPELPGVRRRDRAFPGDTVRKMEA